MVLDEERRPVNPVNNGHEEPEQFMQIADDDEEAEILRRMQESYRQSMQMGSNTTTSG